MDSNKISVLKTICYADIFDYPLTADEVFLYLINPAAVGKNQILETLDMLVFDRVLFKTENFYHLPKRESIVSQRQERKKWSQQKYQKAKRVAHLLIWIPSVLLVGLSGNVAMENAKKEDDIDFFIICSANTIWTTRLFIAIFLSLIGLRRTNATKDVKDTICLNMFVDEKAVALKNKNLYISHEIVQMHPLFFRDDSYNSFLRANKWIRAYLGNSSYGKTHQETNVSFLRRFFLVFFRFIEPVTRGVQYWYMKPHKTIEIISSDTLAFHPNNYAKKVLDLYEKRLKKYTR